MSLASHFTRGLSPTTETGHVLMPIETWTSARWVELFVRPLRARLQIEPEFAASSVARAKAVRHEQDHAPERR